MEINGSNPLLGIKNRLQQIEGRTGSEASQKSCPGQNTDSDLLELSVRSREISHLDEMIRSTPDIREKTVERFRSEVEAGTYNVKAEKIAEKMIGGNLLDDIF
jgi:flagellar biosynthesis anti-sigma factor FlgM